MRDIKFRAWNKLTEQMVTDEAVFIDTDGSIEVGGYSTIDEEGGSIVVMQYTGLTDRNNVEVFEGDVMQHKREVERNGKKHTLIKTWEIKWLEHIAGFDIGGSAVGEVIGNIYENPELLSKGESNERD